MSQMNHNLDKSRRVRYDALRKLSSIDQFTANKYPTFREFEKALDEGRVCGDYHRRITIVSNNVRKSYTFAAE